MKEAFLQAREELIERWLEDNPNGTEEQAESAIEHRIYDHAVDTLCDRADRLRDADKYQ